jgi:hypothetical protein
VACKICGFVGRRISIHVELEHGLSKEDYVSRFGVSTQSSNTREKVKAIARNSGDWINRRKAAGEDLTEYRKKMGEAVSASIMADLDERKRRAEQMAENNRTPEARKKSSETAKKTSARPEIMKARTEKLANWRDLHFDEFYKKCTSVMHNTWHSKPEKNLFEILNNLQGFEFKFSQVVKSENFTNKSKRKQVDVADKHARIYVEYDGILHFKNVFNVDSENNNTKRVQELDVQLERHIFAHNWTLIRISYDQTKRNGSLREGCVKILLDFLKNPKPGIYLIGDLYRLYNHPSYQESRQLTLKESLDIVVNEESRV